MILDKLGSIFEDRRKEDRRITGERRKNNIAVNVEKRKKTRRKSDRRDK